MGFELTTDRQTLIIHHNPLQKGATYTLTLNPNCITDLAGNGLPTQYITSFKTAFTTTSALSKTPINTAPTVTSTNPVNNTVNIPTNKVIKINFSEAIKFGSNSWIELKNSSGKAIQFTKTITGSTLSITPTTKLAKGTTYTVIIHTNSITDLLGKGLTAAYTIKFKTGTV
jgi:methionine-rich copper-binding protein CopC